MKNIILIIGLVIVATGCDGEFGDYEKQRVFDTSDSKEAPFEKGGDEDTALAEDSNAGEGTDSAGIDSELEKLRWQNQKLIEEIETLRADANEVLEENDFLFEENEKLLYIIDQNQEFWCKEFGVCEFHCP
jgi:hypothetical protein